MSRHLSQELADRYRHRTMSEEELIAADEHLAFCEECRRILAEETLNPRIDSLRRSLEPQHVEYAQLEAYVDHTRTAEERDALDLHLKNCSSCAKEVQDLQACKAQLEAKSEEAVKDAGSVQRSLSSRLSLPFRPSCWRTSSRWALATCAVITVAVGGRFVLTWHQSQSVGFHRETLHAELPGRAPHLAGLFCLA